MSHLRDRLRWGALGLAGILAVAGPVFALALPKLEALARLDHPEWDHVRILAETISDGELTDPALPLEALLWRLFHDEEEVRILSSIPLSRGCRCNYEHVKSVLARFGPVERAEMVDDDGFISVDCEFCSRIFPISLSDLED